MVQIYFLSVLLNALAGFILLLDTQEKKFLENNTARLIISLLAVLTGLIQIFSPLKNDIPVIGDIIPAISVIAAGCALFIYYLKTKSSVTVEPGKFIDKFFIQGKKYLGILCIIVSIIHFFVPQVVLL
jgi:hypothetical protein